MHDTNYMIQTNNYRSFWPTEGYLEIMIDFSILMRIL